MPCEYLSVSAFEEFSDAATLAAALVRVGRARYKVAGLKVEALDGLGEMNRLKQAYQVEAARAQAKKKGFFVTEIRQPDGKIKLTVRR